MSDLKTLKDIEEDCINATEPGWSKAGIFEELKAEAVKWVKFYQKHDEETEEAAQWLRMWIVKFFNLTEEDLK